MIREEIVHVNGHPKRIAVFLHGYLDSADAIDGRLREFCDRLPDFAVHIPQSPFPCETGTHLRQWYSMHRFDPESKRRTVDSMEEFVSFYNRMTSGLAETDAFLQPYLEQTLAEYNLDYKDMFLCGFSQGAMQAIWSGLMCPQKIGGLISFSGIIAGYKYLEKNARQHPAAFLLHGTADKYVRPASLEFTAVELRRIGCPVKTAQLNGEGHRLTPEALAQAAQFIRARLRQKAE